jgi:tellurite resistance protein TerC
MSAESWGWLLFNLFILGMLALDLGVFHRTAHRVKIREALAWSAVWIVLALVFAGILAVWRDEPTALQFLTGYVIEKSLSVDNLFVFLLLFMYFQVPVREQHRVLFWGILGALVIRLVFILAGVALINRFHVVIYFFGAIIILTGLKLFFQKEPHVKPERNLFVRLFRRMVPVTDEYVGSRFFTRRDGTLMATPLFVVLLVIETTDIVFAVDSIPAILAVSSDPFIVYTSNVFAILGLRSLYFALAGMMQLFHYLHYGLAFVLVFVGTKMLISDTEYRIPIGVTLAVVCGVLTLSVVLSLLFPPRQQQLSFDFPLPEGEAPSTPAASEDGIQSDRRAIQTEPDHFPPSP